MGDKLPKTTSSSVHIAATNLIQHSNGVQITQGMQRSLVHNGLVPAQTRAFSGKSIDVVCLPGHLKLNVLAVYHSNSIDTIERQTPFFSSTPVRNCPRHQKYR